MATKGTLPLLGPDPATPKALHLVGRYALGIDWQDSHGSIYPFEFLREACRCAACAPAPTGGARAAGTAPPWPTAIEREGGGVRIKWQDGHETAFTGRELRQLCRCAACTVRT